MSKFSKGKRKFETDFSESNQNIQSEHKISMKSDGRVTEQLHQHSFPDETSLNRASFSKISNVVDLQTVRMRHCYCRKNVVKLSVLSSLCT